MDQLDSKNSSHKLQVNCVINFYFHLYLILYTYAVRFNVTENLNFFGKTLYGKVVVFVPRSHSWSGAAEEPAGLVNGTELPLGWLTNCSALLAGCCAPRLLLLCPLRRGGARPGLEEEPESRGAGGEIGQAAWKGSGSGQWLPRGRCPWRSATAAVRRRRLCLRRSASGRERERDRLPAGAAPSCCCRRRRRRRSTSSPSSSSSSS